MNLNEIDLVGLDEEKQKVYLILIDNLTWNDEDKHLECLQEKLLKYVSFIETGEYGKKYPKVENLYVEIKVIFEHELHEVGSRFISQAKLILKETGYNLSFSTFRDT